VTLTFHALSMVCALGAVVFAASVAPHPRALVALAGAFAVALMATGAGWLPDAGLVTLLAAGVAAVRLWTGRYVVVTAVAAGLLAGAWASLLQVQGLPPVVAVAAPAAALAVTAWLSRTRPAFAPEVIREDALLALAVIGVGAAVLPAIVEGWQTATSLTAATTHRVDLAIPAWTLVLVVASTALGVLSAVWSRR
jgi:hypothetical protein